MNDPTPTFQRAVTLLSRGEPLPLDLVFELAGEGIDVAALESHYGL